LKRRKDGALHTGCRSTKCHPTHATYWTKAVSITLFYVGLHNLVFSTNPNPIGLGPGEQFQLLR